MRLVSRPLIVLGEIRGLYLWRLMDLLPHQNVAIALRATYT